MLFAFSHGAMNNRPYEDAHESTSSYSKKDKMSEEYAMNEVADVIMILKFYLDFYFFFLHVKNAILLLAICLFCYYFYECIFG